MKTSLVIGGLAAVLALAACDDNTVPERAVGDGSVASDAGSPAAVAEPSPSATAVAKPKTEPKPAAVSSDYTKFRLEDCTVLSSEEEEGESLEAKCTGYQGVPLYVNVGDGRFDIDVGVTNAFHTISPFNELGETIEWRVANGKPFAVIARLKDVSMETGGNSALIVETVGRSGAPGCRIAHVWNSNANQNKVAREIADESIDPDFVCPAEPRPIR